MKINFYYSTKSLKIFFFVGIIFFMNTVIEAQLVQKTASVRVGRFWIGVTDNGDRGNFSFTSGFFPNDYDILGIRGQYAQANTGTGFLIATLMFNNPYETDPTKKIDTVAVYGLTNQYLPTGKVVTPLTNYIRYKYPQQVINNPTKTETVTLQDFGIYDPSKFKDGTYDQIVEVTNEYVYGITLKRKILGWSQNYNDNYVIFDLEFTNNSNQTYDSLFIQMNTNLDNGEFSNGRNPGPQGNEIGFEPQKSWQHYHGARASDTLMTFYNGKVPGKMRVFYEYGADDPTRPGDNMGAPLLSQNGRLVGTGMHFYTILHASKNAYTNPIDDKDDFLQPRITYTGNGTQLPYTSAGDPYGDKNFWAMRGGLYQFSKMSGNTFSNTYHSVNNDELGIRDWFSYPGGAQNENFMFSSFGPYKLAPGQKVHIVYASGWAGLDPKTSHEIGKSWLKGTLQNPSNMPNQNTGCFPSNFAFPSDATEMDKRKDRWVSTGIDSVMLTAYRAKWNFDHGYKIPQAPPPPSIITISAYGDGTEISWVGSEAESFPNFAGYRIMRRVSNQDTTYYEVIYDSDKNDKAATHTFVDKSVLALAQYYYFIQSKAKIDPNDMNADPTTRGKIMYSGRIWVPNIYWVNPPRLSQDDLSKIRIAPNPYNINDPLLKTYGYTDQRAINFYNLPASCEIKIFTENGDLIKTIRHESKVRAGSETWDMITDSQQVISSGLYIAVIQKPSGENTFLKFIVVR